MDEREAPACGEVRGELVELLFSFDGVGSGKQTQATRLRSKPFYLLSHLTDPSCSFKNEVYLHGKV